MLKLLSSDLFIILIFKLPLAWSELIMGPQSLGWAAEHVLHPKLQICAHVRSWLGY